MVIIMKFKKLTAVLSAVAIMSSTMAFAPVNAANENLPYPDNIDYSISVGTTEVRNMFSWTSPEYEYNTFYVGSKGFTILDTDAQGNYLVLAADLYGKSRFLTGTKDMLNNENLKSSDVNYNPENPNSVGYYMDKTFINGNGSYIPEVIKENIIGIKEGTEKPKWKIEGESVAISDEAKSLIDNNATQSARYKTWLSNNNLPEREIQASIVLPSAKEVEKYKSKIYSSNGNWDGPMTRTMHQRVITNSDNTELVFNARAFRIYYSNQQMQLWSDTEIDNWVIDGDNYYVRPMFMLDKDFFKNVKLTVDDKLGEQVRTEIAKYSAIELISIGYSVHELDELGVELPAQDFTAEVSGFYSNADCTNALTSAKNSDNIYAAFTCTNNTGVACPKTFIIAVYGDDGSFLGQATADIKVAVGTNTYKAGIDLSNMADNVCTAKAMVWNSESEMVPYCVSTLK